MPSLSYSPALNLDATSLHLADSDVVTRRQGFSPAGTPCPAKASEGYERFGVALRAVPPSYDRAAGRPRHAFFGPEQAPLFGCYHPPEAGVSVHSLAVLLCGAQGAEALSSHRSLRALAQGLAADGLPVLRFDWAGEGDSASGVGGNGIDGIDGDGDGGDAACDGRVGDWLASIDHALDALRTASGCTRIAVVGVQLGALLSAQVLPRHRDIVAWLAVAPAPSGKQFLRERLALGHLGGGDMAAPDAQPLLEAGGFAYTQAMREALGALTLEPAVQAVGTALVVFQRDDLPLPARVRAALGEPCEWHDVGGYAQMVDEPHLSVVPQGLIAALRSRLGALAALAAAPSQAPRAPFGRLQACWAGAAEEVVHLDVGAGSIGPFSLFGLLSLPAHGPVRRTVLMVNAGAIRHVGPSGLYTHLARRWAAQGVAVLRIDLSGLGESPPQPDEPDNVVYSPSAVAEVVEAARWLARRTGVAQTQVLGLCAGAYHALQAAVVGAPVQRVLALNPLTFSQPGAQPFATGPDAHVLSAVGQALGRALRHGWHGAGVWRRLACGQLPVSRVLRRVLAYGRWRVALQARRTGFALARWVGMPLSHDLLAQLLGLAGRGVQIDFVFADDEPGPALIAQQTGACVGNLQARALLTMHVIEQADHVFTTQASRCRLELVLDALVLPPADVREACAGQV